MDYLRSFIIGSSGLVFVQHLILLSLAPESHFDYSYKIYSINTPLYYGLMNMLALYIGKTFNLSLKMRLFVTSIISVIYIVSLSYFVSSKLYKPYKEYDNKDWIRYILRNGARHLVAFNVIIYFLETYFPKSYPLRLFVIGSSVASFLITYLKVAWMDLHGQLNYDYKIFAPAEPLLQGFYLLITVAILQLIMGFSLPATLVIKTVLGSLAWFVLAYSFKTYRHQGTYEWLEAFSRVLVTSIFRAYVIYYLLTEMT